MLKENLWKSENPSVGGKNNFSLSTAPRHTSSNLLDFPSARSSLWLTQCCETRLCWSMTPLLPAKQSTGFPRSYQWHHRDSVLGKLTDLLLVCSQHQPCQCFHLREPPACDEGTFDCTTQLGVTIKWHLGGTNISKTLTIVYYLVYKESLPCTDALAFLSLMHLP